MNRGACRGVFDLLMASCYVFIAGTPQTTVRVTSDPTQSPTKVPTKTHTEVMQPTVPPTPTTPPSSSPILTKTSPHPTPAIPNENTSSQPTPPSQPSPTVIETPSPTTSPTLPPKVPTPIPTDSSRSGHEPPSRVVLAPSRSESRNEDRADGEGFDSMCSFDAFEGQCIMVYSFDDFYEAITQGGDEIVFCGGFRIEMPGSAPVRITTDTNIRCLDTCTFFGIGPFLEVGGAMTKVRFSNMKLMMAESDTAVLVATMTSLSETTFCDMEFEGNKVRTGQYGGAINVDQRSGVVNVVGTTFTDNSASKGGAIYSHAFILNIIDSRFVANKALDVGNAIYVGEETQISIKSTTFILNESVDDGPKTRNYAIAVEPSNSNQSLDGQGAFIDAGMNRVIMSGDCSGFFNLVDLECLEFVTRIVR
jgi:predicted outer membrane repeat protein